MLDEAGLLFSIIDGYEEKISDNISRIVSCSIDNIKHPFEEFRRKSALNPNQEDFFMIANNSEVEKIPRLFVILGDKTRIGKLENLFRSNTKSFLEDLMRDKKRVFHALIKKINERGDIISFELFLSLFFKEITILSNEEVIGTKFPYCFVEEKEEYSILVCYGSKPNIGNKTIQAINECLRIWDEIEKPKIKGKQIETVHSLEKKLIGRRIKFLTWHNEWMLVLDDGLKISLTEDFQEHVNDFYEEMSEFYPTELTINTLQKLLYNPIYAFGLHLEPIDLLIDWKKMFFYRISHLKYDSLSLEDFGHLYGDFLDFVKDFVCEKMGEAEAFVDKEVFLKSMIVHIEHIKEYLRGREEPNVSRNFLYTVRSRSHYLPFIDELLQKYFPEIHSQRIGSNIFDEKKWKDHMMTFQKFSMDKKQKGRALEELVVYFFETIKGFLITGIRQHQEREEIDLYCCNVSYDSSLWKVGALILAECKNKDSKSVSGDIKKLIPTMEAKGITTAIFFSPSGFTKPAYKEVEEQSFQGRSILIFDQSDLLKISASFTPYDSLKEKIIDVEIIRDKNVDRI